MCQPDEDVDEPVNSFLRPGMLLLQAGHLLPQGLVIGFMQGRLESVLSHFPFIHGKVVSSLVTLSW